MREQDAHGALVGTRDWQALGALLLTWTLAVLLVRPWEGAPFAPADFSEFLPVLQSHHGVLDTFSALMVKYAGEGRFNVIAFYGLALKWTLFGDSPVAWQIIRAAQMFALTLGAFALLRRLRCSPWAAAAGASLFVVSASAISAWTRLTMGEPIATLFVIGASLLAVGYGDAPRWKARAIAIAALLAGALLTKELFVGAIPFIVLLACCRDDDGRWSWPRLVDPRVLALLGAIAVASVLVLAPVAWVATHARAGSFVSGYSAHGIDANRMAITLSAVLLPWPQVGPSPFENIPTYANLAFKLSLLAFLLAPGRRSTSWLVGTLAAGFALPLAFGVLYLPWIYFLPFYALPAMIGSAFLLASAVDLVADSLPRMRPVMALVWIAAFALGLQLTTAMSEWERAVRRVHARVASRVATDTEARQVAVTAREPRTGAQAWQGRGPTLVRYGTVITGHAGPPTIEVDCRRAASLIRDGGDTPMLLVTFSDDCGTPSHPTWTVREVYHVPTLWPPGLLADSVRADGVRIFSTVSPAAARP